MEILSAKVSRYTCRENEPLDQTEASSIPDAVRSTACWPQPDGDIYRFPNGAEADVAGYVVGSAHRNGFSTGFADGSVRMLDYEIELEVFNSLAHRADGQ